jgi:hypothetical protein
MFIIVVIFPAVWLVRDWNKRADSASHFAKCEETDNTFSYVRTKHIKKIFGWEVEQLVDGCRSLAK